MPDAESEPDSEKHWGELTQTLLASESDENAGFGKYGTCCGEMDIWEANSQSQAYTSHPCTIESQYMCEGQECGDNASDERYDGVCDKDGCDYASFRLGDQVSK